VKKVEEPVKKTKGDADSSSDEESENDDPANIVAARKAADAKLKRDLKEEQQEMAKVLMTNRQRKLYQKAEEDQKTKQLAVQKLRVKRKAIEKKK